MKRSLVAVVGFVLAAALLALFFWRTDWEGLLAALGHARFEILAAALALVVASFFLRAFRWGYLLRPVAETSFRNRLHAFVEGYTVTNLLPGRVGEVVRPYLLSRDEPRATFGAALATIVVERVLDMLTLAAMLAAYLMFRARGMESDDLRGALTAGAWLGAGAVVVLLALFGWTAARPDAARRFFGTAARRLPARFHDRVEGFTEQFMRGLGALREPRLALSVLASSAAMWLVIALYTWLCLAAVGVETGFFSAFLFVPATALGIALPTPGGIGGYHAVFQLALVDVYGVEGGAASAGILLAHGVSYVPLTLWGVILLWRRGFSWREMTPPPSGGAASAQDKRA